MNLFKVHKAYKLATFDSLKTFCLLSVFVKNPRKPFKISSEASIQLKKDVFSMPPWATILALVRRSEIWNEEQLVSNFCSRGRRKEEEVVVRVPALL